MTERPEQDVQKEILQKLLENPVLGKADPSLLAQAVPHCQLINYRAGRKLIREGEKAQEVFALVSGGVRVFHLGPNGDEIVVKIFGPPVFFGEADVLLKIAWLESVETLMPTQVVRMPGNIFEQLLARDHRLCYTMVHDLAARLLIATEHERMLAFGSAEVRLAEYFVDHANLFGVAVEGGTLLDVKLSQESLGRSLAISRKTVNQIMQRWKDEGLLGRKSGRYVIHDIETLRAKTSSKVFSLAYTLDKLELIKSGA